MISRSCCISWPPRSSDTHRMASYTCWTATSASKQSQNAFRTARTSLTWSSPVKRESMTKCWRVRILHTAMMLIVLVVYHSRLCKQTHIFSYFLLKCLFFSLVIADLNSREQETLQPVHVINVDIQDNHEEATLGAFLICELCQCVSVTGSQVLLYTYRAYIKPVKEVCFLSEGKDTV